MLLEPALPEPGQFGIAQLRRITRTIAEPFFDLSRLRVVLARKSLCSAASNHRVTVRRTHEEKRPLRRIERDVHSVSLAHKRVHARNVHIKRSVREAREGADVALFRRRKRHGGELGIGDDARGAVFFAHDTNDQAVIRRRKRKVVRTVQVGFAYGNLPVFLGHLLLIGGVGSAVTAFSRFSDVLDTEPRPLTLFFRRLEFALFHFGIGRMPTPKFDRHVIWVFVNAHLNGDIDVVALDF